MVFIQLRYVLYTHSFLSYNIHHQIHSLFFLCLMAHQPLCREFHTSVLSCVFTPNLDTTTSISFQFETPPPTTIHSFSFSFFLLLLQFILLSISPTTTAFIDCTFSPLFIFFFFFLRFEQ